MLPDLFDLLRPLKATPDVPLEAEEYFTAVVAAFDDRGRCRAHLEAIVPGMFTCLRDRPDWIQDPAWQWFKGRPMAFVGSIDAPAGTFHDDARFYLFWSPEEGVTECVIQVS